MKIRTRTSLIIFSIVTLLSGWFGYIVDGFIPQQESETIGMALWLVLPLFAMILLKLLSRENWREQWLFPKLAENGKWYIFSLIVFPAVTVFIIIIGKILGWVDVSNFNSKTYFSVFLVTLLPNFVKNIFEEFVWRGYLASKLIRLEINDIWIYLIIGSIWGLWHMPYYLFFLPEKIMLQILPVGRLAFAVIATLTMVCWAVMFVELFRITSSVWAVVVLHAVEDSFVNHLIIDKHIEIANGTEILISPIIGILASIIYLAIGLGLRKKRLNKENQNENKLHRNDQKRTS